MSERIDRSGKCELSLKNLRGFEFLDDGGRYRHVIDRASSWTHFRPRCAYLHNKGEVLQSLGACEMRDACILPVRTTR